MEGEVQRLRRVCEAGSAIRSSGEVHARMVEEVAEKLLAEFARLEKEKTELEAQRVKLGEERARLEAMRAVLFSEGSDEQAAPAPPVRAPAASVVAAAAVAAAVRGEMVCWAGVEQTVRWTPSYVGYTLHFAEARPRRLFSLFVASSSERYEVCLDGTAVAVRVPGKLGAVREGYIRIDLVQVLSNMFFSLLFLLSVLFCSLRTCL